jgi:hypothetical protein
MDAKKSYVLCIFLNFYFSISFLPWELSPSSYYSWLSILFRITSQSLSIDKYLLFSTRTSHFHCLLLISTVVTFYPISVYSFEWGMILSILGLSFLSNYCLKTFVFRDQVFYMSSMFYFILTERFLGSIHSIPSNRRGSVKQDNRFP